ncbi:CCR4-NOT regulatory complex component [Paramarasmius palmivorus]|uniref:CCR4-NOT regulatory complex component n=1 Tax=Paramarasmius palmivorus TaxID=297713 RepID=A0AAW0AUL1_9AGAR
MDSQLAITINDLSYNHNAPSELPPEDDYDFPGVLHVTFNLPQGSRTLLIGGNGAGKSTLLYILAGKRMTQHGEVKVFGRDVFREFGDNVVYLGTEWFVYTSVPGHEIRSQKGHRVSHFLDSVGGYRYKERRDRLLNILDIDLDWHMHTISDGERRRVQLCMGLMSNWDVLLMDEVTVDLDVLTRYALLKFLKQETEERNATIIYATHIFDGLDDFPTHVAHMREGRFVMNPTPWPIEGHPYNSSSSKDTSLHQLAIAWIGEDRAVRQREEKEGKRKKVRGARSQEVPTDSETFYKKYDYSH